MARRLRSVVLFLIGTVIWGPASAIASDAEAGSEAANQSETAVRATELAFAASARDRDLERFRSFLDPEARFLGEGGAVHEGPEAIAAAWAPFFAADGPGIDWWPERVTVNEERGLAVSTGSYEIETPDGARLRGTFFSVWRRREDGQWRILFDGGTSPEAVENGG